MNRLCDITDMWCFNKLLVHKIYFYLEFDESFNGSCCFMLVWLTFGAFVALCKLTGGDFDTIFDKIQIKLISMKKIIFYIFQSIRKQNKNLLNKYIGTKMERERDIENARH